MLLWWITICFEGLILLRGFQTGLSRKYPLFYSYIGFILLVDIGRYSIYTLARGHWNLFYWASQGLSVLVGYGVILEILHHTLDRYPGAERFGRFLILLVFGAAFGFAMFRSMSTLGWSPAGTTVELERDLRAVQVLVLSAILVVIYHYRIGIGRNLKGIVFGYGLFIGFGVMNFAARSYAGERLNLVWADVQRYSFVAAVAIWVMALWSFSPDPNPTSRVSLESDYEALAARTRSMLGFMRSVFWRSARP
jgi:hypothetical protein